MKVKLVSPDGSRERVVTVDQSTILGKGGEATVHRDPDHPSSRAIKIYHDPTSARGNKLRGFLDGDEVFPKGVAAPEELVVDSRGKIVGFSMHQLSRRYKMLRELFKKSVVDREGITTQTVAELFVTIGEQLQRIHSLGYVVGDLNDGAIMFDLQPTQVGWVDVDSWHTDDFPCSVGTELYLSPELYGIDLSSGSYFKPHHDHFSYAVLLFRALLRKHPFKAGKHKKHRGVIDRAQHGLTLLDTSVEFPSAGLQPDMLSDELADALLQHLKRESTDPFPINVLREYGEILVPCSTCGMWYPSSRKNCPQCAAKTVVDLSVAPGVDLLEFIETAGKILFVQVQGKRVFAVASENSSLLLYTKEPQEALKRVEIGIAHRSSMRFGVFQDVLVICNDNSDEELGELYLFEIRDGKLKPLQRSTTGVLAGDAPVFATSRKYLYRMAKNMILRTERFMESELLESPVTEELNGQTWFTCDPNPSNKEEVLFGFTRDLHTFGWFVVHGDRDGQVFQKREVNIPSLRSLEAMIDFSLRFSGGEVLLVRKTKKSGKEFAHLSRIESKTGEVISSEILKLDDHLEWEDVHGKAFAKNVVMHSTDNGVVRERVDTHDTKLLLGTDSIVTSGEALLPYGKAILVVKRDRVELLTKR